MNAQEATEALRRELATLHFGAPVTHVYNPLEYARANYEAYLATYGQPPKQVVVVGMNPGPWGMAQTGVPFGDPVIVREWLRLQHPVGQPSHLHPKRPVEGLGSSRREVSGSRLWGAAAEHFGTPARFFAHFFVANYCPLCFFERSGANRTPDKLSPSEREPLFALCDLYLRRLVAYLGASHVVGVGQFAATRAQAALADAKVQVSHILHPSPASPAANRGWAEQAKAQLVAAGLCKSARR